ncbi:MAG: pitrilysin family protein [Dehalococcoidia bacterium]
MEYKNTTLENGLRVVTCRMPHTRSVSLLFFVMTGSCYENDGEAGISHFIEHMCFKGTTKRSSSREISEAIEGVGGILNGGTDRELTSYWCKLASRHLETAVDVITDLMRRPLFREEDIEKERQVIIEEINMSLDSPQQRVGMILDDMMWPGKPLGRDVAGTKETVTAITRSQMLERVERFYTPANMLASIAGDFDRDNLLAMLSRAGEGWQAGGQPGYIDSRVSQTRPQTRIEYRETEQVNLILGLEGLSVFDPDRFALDLLSMVLGEGMSCRLFTEIREKLGLAYDIHSYVEHFRETGSFVIQAGIDPAQTERAIKAIQEQLATARDGISAEELDKAREMAKGRMLLSMENSRTVAGWYGAQEMLTDKIMTIDDVTRIIDEITLEDIRRVVGGLFTTEKLNLAIVGPVRDEAGIAGLLRL